MNHIKSFLALILLSITLHTFAQNKSRIGAVEAISSLYGNILYQGDVNPRYANPSWTMFFETGENSQVAIVPTGLKIVTSANGGVYGYKLSGVNIDDNANHFSLQHRSSVTSSKSGLSIDLRTKTGNRVNIMVLSNAIVNVATGDTLIKNINNTNFANYRVSSQGTTAAIYKDSVQMGTVSSERTDVIPDAGFELNEINAMWGGDGYAPRKIETATANVRTGLHSMVWSNGWNGRFIGKIKVQPNSKYRVSYWAKLKILSSSNGQTKMNGGLWVSGLKVADLPVNNTTTFTKQTAEFTSGPECNEVQLIYHNGWTSDGNYAIYFDDFELTQLEGQPYLQFGKLSPTNGADFTVSNISYTPAAYKPVSLSGLKSLLLQAKNNVSAAVVGAELNQYPQFAVQKINAEISKVDLAIQNSPLYLTIDTSYYYLNKAMTIFTNSKITSTTVKLASIQASVASPQVKKLFNSQITLVGKMTDNTDANMAIAQVNYNIVGNACVTVSNTGLIMGIAVGKTKIETVVQLSDVVLKDTFEIEVLDYYFSTLHFAPYASDVEVNEATGTSLHLLMNDGTVPDTKSVEIKYVNLTPLINDLNAFGTIIPRKIGEAKVAVEVTVLGITLKDTVVVQCNSLSSIALSIPITILQVSDAGTYTYSANMSTGNVIDVSDASALVVSDNRNVIRLDNKGNMKALKAGVTNIRFIVNRNGKTLTQAVNVEVKSQINGLFKHNFKKKELSIYPNPASAYVKVQHPESINSIEITDLSGRVLEKQATSDIISLSEIKNGIYLLKIEVGNAVEVSKLVVRK